MKKNLLLCFTLLTALHSVSAKAKTVYDDIKFNDVHYDACKSVPTLKEDDYKKNKQFWDHAMKDCHAQVQVVPATGFFESILFHLKKSDKADSFLESVGQRALSYVRENNKYTEILVRCERKDEAWFKQQEAAAKNPEDKEAFKYADCGKVVQSMLSTVDKIRPELRHQLALAKDGNNGEGINTNLNKPFGFIAPKMEPLSGSEVRSANYEYAQETAELNKQYDDLLMLNRDDCLKHPIWTKLITETSGDPAMASGDLCDRVKKGPGTDRSSMEYQQFMTQLRPTYQRKHGAKYMDELEKAPILAYLGERNPTPAQIADAAEKVLKNGQKEEANLNSLIQGAVSSREIYVKGEDVGTHVPDSEEKAKALLSLMKYRPVVNELVKENPGNCNTAIELANYITHTGYVKDGALVAGTIGMSAFVAVAAPAALAGTALEGISGGVLATFAAMPVSAGMYASSYSDFSTAKRRALSVVADDGTHGHAISTVEDYKEAKDSLTISLAMAATGIDFWGSGLGKGAIAVGSAAIAGKIFEKQGAELALRKVLTGKGMGEDAVATLFRDLKSSDPVVASKAAAKVVQKLDLNPDEIKLMRVAAQKGFLGTGPNNTRYLDEILKGLPENPAKRKEAVREALAIFEQMNPAKMNEFTREKAAKAAVAAANFGIKDPARIASALAEWDAEGVEGLTKAYKLAARKMNTPEMLKISSVEERQAKAFDSALDDLMQDKPEFKAMTAAERAKAKGEMCTCAACKL